MALPVIEPVRPVLRKRVPTGDEWRYEPKIDGFRGTLYADGGRGFFRSKTMRLMRRFDSLALDSAQALPVRSAILDGEISQRETGSSISAR